MPGDKVNIVSGNFKGQTGYVAKWDLNSDAHLVVYNSGFKEWIHNGHLETLKNGPAATCDCCGNVI
jgi:hypothetical protein